jgi:hypothetical protein
MPHGAGKQHGSYPIAILLRCVCCLSRLSMPAGVRPPGTGKTSMKFALMALALLSSAQQAYGHSVSGNINAAFSTSNGDVTLTLKNVHPETPAMITSVDLLLPQHGHKDSKQVSLFNGASAIHDDTQIALGSAVSLVAKLYPQAMPAQIEATHPTVSDNQDADCVNCHAENVGIAFRLVVSFGPTVSQKILTTTFLHLTAPMNIQTRIISAPEQ